MTLDEMLQPGNTLRLSFYEGNPNNGLLHIRAIVDEHWVVYRTWSRRKQHWRYTVESRHLFELYYKDGELTLERRAK